MTQPTHHPPCTLPTVGTDQLAAPCGACGHTNLVHPSLWNSSLRACAICEVLVARDHMLAVRDAYDPEVNDDVVPR